MHAKKINFLKNKNNADILCLLGDICVCGVKEDWIKYTAFIHNLSTIYKHIILITGNHEYYTIGSENRQTMSEINTKIKNFVSNYNNIHFLLNESVTLEINNKKAIFIGSTLWTYINPEHRSYIQEQMNDYNSIYISNKKFTVHDMVALHQEAIAFIEFELKRLVTSKDNIILLTHHKPYSDTISTDNITSQAYESDIPFIKNYANNITFAAHGHTHKQVDRVINGIRMVSMPKGYPNEKTNYKDAKHHFIDV
jgi:hypothetical protein